MRIERIEPITLRVPWGPAGWGEFRDWTIAFMLTTGVWASVGGVILG